MSSATPRQGRLSTVAAAMVIARRDFLAILFARSFISFLLAPVMMVGVTLLAGSIGHHGNAGDASSNVGIAMLGADVDAMLAARGALAPRMGDALPELVVVKRLAAGEAFDPRAALKSQQVVLAAVLTGSPAAPILTGPVARIAAWQGPISMVAARALGRGPTAYPDVTLARTVTSAADTSEGRTVTAEAAQTLMFLLTMLLAGMVLSNLVEEKGNKIIEILAAAIPMDAVFLGKLFAMLAISLVGISVWALAGGLIAVSIGGAMPSLPAPAVGWGLFFVLGVVYFSMAYLVLGSIFLAIGSMAATVRDVQTLSMPVTMSQVLVFFFASYALAHPGGIAETVAMWFPLTSPFTMLAHAATSPALLPHAVALAWQVLCVAILVRAGATLFRRRVMHSGPASVGGKRRWFRRAKA